jgi:hypothetical protein
MDQLDGEEHLLSQVIQVQVNITIDKCQMVISPVLAYPVTLRILSRRIMAECRYLRWLWVVDRDLDKGIRGIDEVNVMRRMRMMR